MEARSLEGSIVLRVLCGIAVIAYIFVHSPERHSEGTSQDSASWIDRARREIAEAILRSPAAHELARRSLASTDKTASRGQ